MRLGLGLDEVHLLDAHVGMVCGSADLEILISALRRTELDIRVIGQFIEVFLALFAAAFVVVGLLLRVFAVGIEPRMAAEVAQVDTVVEVAVDAAAGVVSVGAPCVLGTHVRREAEKVGDALARQGEAPDPGIVRRGAVEAVRGVLPLLLRKGRAAAGGDGLPGVLGRLRISGIVLLRRAPLEPGPGFQSVNQRQADRVLVGGRKAAQQLFGLVQVGEDHLVVDVIDLGAGVVLGLGLGGLGQYDGHAQPENLGRFGVVVLLELVQTHQIEVEHGPIGVGEAQIGLLRGVERGEVRGVDLLDDVVGRHDPRIVVVPRERAHGIVGPERFVGSPLCEPVVADIAADGDVARHGFRGDMDGRQGEIPGLAILCVTRGTGLYERGRNTLDQRFEGHLILGGYFIGVGFFDAAACQQSRRQRRERYVCRFFHSISFVVK